MFSDFQVNLLFGGSGAGKTRLALEIIEKLERGEPIFGFPARRTNCFYIALDHSREAALQIARQMELSSALNEDAIGSRFDLPNLSFKLLLQQLPSNTEFLLVDDLERLVPDERSSPLIGAFRSCSETPLPLRLSEDLPYSVHILPKSGAGERGKEG